MVRRVMVRIGRAIREEVSDCIFWIKPVVVIAGIVFAWTAVLVTCKALISLMEIIPLLLIK